METNLHYNEQLTFDDPDPQPYGDPHNDDYKDFVDEVPSQGDSYNFFPDAGF